MSAGSNSFQDMEKQKEVDIEGVRDSQAHGRGGSYFSSTSPFIYILTIIFIISSTYSIMQQRDLQRRLFLVERNMLECQIGLGIFPSDAKPGDQLFAASTNSETSDQFRAQDVSGSGSELDVNEDESPAQSEGEGGYVMSGDFHQKERQMIHVDDPDTSTPGSEFYKAIRFLAGTSDRRKQPPDKAGLLSRNKREVTEEPTPRPRGRTAGEQKASKRHQGLSRKDRRKLIKKCETKAEEVARKVVKAEMANKRVSMAHFAARMDPTINKLRAHIRDQPVKIESGILLRGSLNPREDKHYCFWEKNEDTDDKVFTFDKGEGIVTVQTSGTYLLYAQVLYYEPGPRVAFSVKAGNRTLTKCLVAPANLAVETDSADAEGAAPSLRHEDYQMCSSTLAVVLTKGTQLFIDPLYEAQKVIPDPAATLWGLVRLGG